MDGTVSLQTVRSINDVPTGGVIQKSSSTSPADGRTFEIGRRQKLSTAQRRMLFYQTED